MREAYRVLGYRDVSPWQKLLATYYVMKLGVRIKHCLDVIAGTEERFDLFAKIPSMRIPGVTAFGKTIVSLGMTYYALKDKL